MNTIHLRHKNIIESIHSWEFKVSMEAEEFEMLITNLKCAEGTILVYSDS